MLLFTQPIKRQRQTTNSQLETFFKTSKSYYRLKLGWQFYLREVKLRYLFSEANFAGLLLEVVKMIANDLRGNFLLTVRFFFIIKVYEIDSKHYQYLNSLVQSDSVWQSRQAILGGINPKVLDEVIDYDFSRKKHLTQIRIWATSRTPSVTNSYQDPYAIEIGAKLIQAERDSRSNLHYVELGPSYIHHGRVITKNSSIIAIRSDQLSPSKSWPTDSFVEFNKSYHLFSSIKIRNEREVIFLGISNSWYHFLVEYLPRYLSIPKNKRSVPTAIPINTPPQIVEILTIVGYSNLVVVNLRETLQASNLITVKDYRFENPFDFKARTNEILHLQKVFAELDLGQRFIPANNRILIKRPKNTFRKMNNFSSVQLLLSDIGFYTYSPEEMSAASQIETFRNAQIIIGQSGAALTSLLFSKPGTVFIELGDWSKSHENFFWRSFAQILGLRTETIYGKSNWRTRNLFDSFDCNLKELERIVNLYI
jgi:hypothetical protein